MLEPWGPKKRRETLDNVLRHRGYGLAAYSPGDGVTRYRIVRLDEHGHADYFASRDLATAFGLQEAERLVSAFLAGLDERTRKGERKEKAYPLPPEGLAG